MPVILNLEDKIINLIRGERYKWFTTGVNLGGVTGISGGTGSPIGGFIGQLIQSKVTYDTSENEIWDVPVSGESLVTNLDRIRYRLATLESSGGGGSGISYITIHDEGIDQGNVTILDFEGAGVTATVSGSTATITVVASGSASNLDDLLDVTIITPSDGDILYYHPTSGWLNQNAAEIGLSEVGHTHIEVDITNLDHDAVSIRGIDVVDWAPTASGDVLVYDGNVYAPGTISGGGGSTTFLDLTDVDEVSYTGFDGYSVVVNTGEDGLEFVNVSGGAGGAYTFVLDDMTSQIPAGGDNFITAAVPASGSLVIHYNGLTQQPNNYNITTSGFHTLFSPLTGDELVAEYYTDVPTENILALTLDVEDASTPVATNVEVLNFEGMDVSVDGTTVTVSGGTGTGGGGDVSVEDEGSEITSSVTSIDFVGPAVLATNIGNDVTVTVSGVFIDSPPFIGCKTYQTSDQQLTTGGGWQNISWDAEDYDTDTMWTSGAYQQVNTNGYFSVTGQVTISGALPTDSVQLGIFKNSTLLSTGWDGFYTTTSGNRTYMLQGEGSFVDTDSIVMAIVCFSADQPYVITGIENTFLASHQILGALSVSPEVCRVQYTSYLNVSDSTNTAIPWSNETYDTGNFWSSGTSTRFTISTDGYYRLKAITLWESVYYQGGTPFTIRVGFRKNGSTQLASHWNWNDVDTGGARSEGRSTETSTDVYLEVNDYVEVVVYHEKGSVANGIIRANDTWATIQRIA